MIPMNNIVFAVLFCTHDGCEIIGYYSSESCAVKAMYNHAELFGVQLVYYEDEDVYLDESVSGDVAEYSVTPIAIDVNWYDNNGMEGETN